MPAKRLPRPLPSVEFLRESLAYDPLSGELTWKLRPAAHFKTEGARKASMHLVGKVAGSKSDLGYILVRVKYALYKAHRVAWAIHHGSWPLLQIDHINGNKSDNSLANLQEVTNLVNCHGHTLSPRNNSGVMGIFWDIRRLRWCAKIMVDGRAIHLGYHRNLEAAKQARLDAEMMYEFSAWHGIADPTVTPEYREGRLPKRNTSGRAGVYMHKKTGRWVSVIHVDGVRKYLGMFDSIDAAIACRSAAEAEYGYHPRKSSGTSPILPA